MYSLLSRSKIPALESAEELVFSNELLLELILEKAIKFNNQGLGYTGNSNTANFRLVNKNWYRAIAKLYRKHKNYLFHLQLTQENTCGKPLLPSTSNSFNRNQRQIQPFRSLLQRFVFCMAHWDSGVSPFHLELTPTFFKVADESYYQTLFDFLFEYAGENMIRFTFNFQGRGDDRTHSPLEYPSFNLTNLRHLELKIERVAWSYIPFLQNLLNCAPNLETLEFTSSACLVSFNVNHLAEAIAAIANQRPSIITLPMNIRRVLLYATTDSCSCFYIIRFADLSKLETLSVSASTCIHRLIDEIFESLARQILHLNLISYRSCSFLFGTDFATTFPRFPALRSLTITAPWDPMLCNLFVYETHLPLLEELTLIHYNDRTITTFLVGRKTLTVKKLNLVTLCPYTQATGELMLDDDPLLGGLRWSSTKISWMEPIPFTFPNLTHLGVGVSSGVGANALLQKINAEMSNIKSLALYVEASYKFKMMINFDSIFVGLKSNVCQSLKNAPEYWDSMNLMEGDAQAPKSIRNLTNLQSLYLVECTYPSCPGFRSYAEGEGDSVSDIGDFHEVCDFTTNTLPTNREYLFSELSFYFSFYRMDNLKNLTFTKGFMPSIAVQEKWARIKGTKIRQIRSPKTTDMLNARFSLSDESWYYT